MIIAAFDIATITGVCDGPVGGKPRPWSWYLRDAGDSRPERLHLFSRFVAKYLEQERCDAVVYEAPMPLGVIGQNTKDKHGKPRIMVSEANVALARGLIGVLEMNCAKFEKPVQPASVQDARSSVLGWRTNRGGGGPARVQKRDGSARDETVKERVVREVAMLGIKHADGSALNDNEADAYVLWQFACNLQNPRLAVAQTPLFRELL